MINVKYIFGDVEDYEIFEIDYRYSLLYNLTKSE